MNYVIAPPAYHGDWTGMTAADSLSVDIYLKNLGGGVVNPEYIFRIAGPGGAAHALSGAAYYPADSVWTHYTVSLDESQWVIEQGTWDAILANVNTLRITGEFVNGNEACRVDNVVLSGSPAAIWEPCLWDTFTTGGTGDWSYQNTGGVTNPGSGGNGGGYLRITDAAGISVMLAPATFLGDWSPMDGLGYVSLDVRILSGSGERLGLIEFIRLSGPGGSAYVTLDTADLPPVGNAWQHIRYPLDPAVWTVDAGQWTALLADVAECRICMEFFTGSEVVGLDNFGRGMADCAPPDDTVVVHDPEMHVADGFGTLEPGCLEVDAPTRRLWVTDVGRGRVYELRLPGGAGVDVSVALEGSQRPDPEGWRIPLRIRCFEPGADVMSEAPAAFYHLRAEKQGEQAMCTLPALSPGVYDVAASSDHTLMNVKRDVLIAAPSASVDVGTLAEGDADADGAIDLKDVARLSAAGAAAHVSGTCDAAADFDRNLQIDLEDLLLLAGHWLEQSPVEVD